MTIIMTGANQLVRATRRDRWVSDPCQKLNSPAYRTGVKDVDHDKGCAELGQRNSTYAALKQGPCLF